MALEMKESLVYQKSKVREECARPIMSSYTAHDMSRTLNQLQFELSSNLKEGSWISSYSDPDPDPFYSNIHETGTGKGKDPADIWILGVIYKSQKDLQIGISESQQKMKMCSEDDQYIRENPIQTAFRGLGEECGVEPKSLEDLHELSFTINTVNKKKRLKTTYFSVNVKCLVPITVPRSFGPGPDPSLDLRSDNNDPDNQVGTHHPYEVVKDACYNKSYVFPYGTKQDIVQLMESITDTLPDRDAIEELAAIPLTDAIEIVNFITERKLGPRTKAFVWDKKVQLLTRVL